MGKLIRKEALFVALESAYNTEATPTATDAILCEDLSWNFEGLRRTERPAIKATLPPLKSVYGGTLIAVSGTVELKGSGTAGTEPEIDAILQIAGFSRTDVVSTSNSYKPSSDTNNHKSATIIYQEDGDYFKITGARASSLSVSGETGGIAKVAFTVVGHFAGQVTGTVATPTFADVEPATLKGVGVDLSTKSPIISTFSLELGLETATPADMSADDGYGEIRITGRNASGSFDAEAVTKAQHDYITDFLNNVDQDLTIGPIGSVAGNKVTINAPSINRTDVTQGDRDGIRLHEYPFEAREATADDEIEILFE